MSIYDWRPFLFGGLASVAAEIATFPLDTVKARLQVQGQELGHLAIRYHGLIDGMNTIVRQEGFVTLYNGYI
jgi:solute carrier family 25 protein 14/30